MLVELPACKVHEQGALFINMVCTCDLRLQEKYGFHNALLGWSGKTHGCTAQGKCLCWRYVVQLLCAVSECSPPKRTVAHHHHVTQSSHSINATGPAPLWSGRKNRGCGLCLLQTSLARLCSQFVYYLPLISTVTVPDEHHLHIMATQQLKVPCSVIAVTHAVCPHPADITGALKSALPQGSISTGCPITAYKQQEDGTIQLLGPAASSSSGASEAEVVATCNILIGEQLDHAHAPDATKMHQCQLLPWCCVYA
jgi:hypothetical protein